MLRIEPEVARCGAFKFKYVLRGPSDEQELDQSKLKVILNFFLLGCAVYPQPTSCPEISLDDRVAILKKTLFAVKTCPKYHLTRLQVKKSMMEFNVDTLIAF